MTLDPERAAALRLVGGVVLAEREAAAARLASYDRHLERLRRSYSDAIGEPLRVSVERFKRECENGEQI